MFTTNVRLLHDELGVKANCGDWFRFQIKRFDLIENQDYTVSTEKTWENGFIKRYVYLVTDDVANQIRAGRFKHKTTKPAHTYFIYNPSTNLIKIGKSVETDKRFAVLQTQVGCKLELLHVVEDDIESELHLEFASIRQLGEWFTDDGSIRARIESFQQ